MILFYKGLCVKPPLTPAADSFELFTLSDSRLLQFGNIFPEGLTDMTGKWVLTHSRI